MASKKKPTKATSRTSAKPGKTTAESAPKRGSKAKKRSAEANAPAKPQKLSALDAAAQVLSEAGQPLNCQEMIAAMTEKGYWTSPAGKTPQATLYSALLREIKTKGDESRFQKTERGKFARTQAS
jgi:hypothetical protein